MSGQRLEIRRGELLGTDVRSGQRTDLEPSRAREGLEKNLAWRLRQLAHHWDDIADVIPLRPRTLPDPTPERWARIMAEVARDEARREAEIAHICGQFRARLRVVR